MKEAEFDKRWSNRISKLADKGADEQLVSLLRRFYFPQTIWRYNQIVGYVAISISKFTIWIDWWLALNKNEQRKKFRFDSRKRQFMFDVGTLHHFRVEKDNDNELIKEGIKKCLNSDEIYPNDIIRKYYYIDMTTFENQIKHLDIRRAIDET